MIRAKRTGEEEKQKSSQEENEAVEDEVAQARHIKALKNEYAKVHKNAAVAAELMKLTFEGRRREVASNMRVGELLLKYPFLQNYEEASYSSHIIYNII